MPNLILFILSIKTIIGLYPINGMTNSLIVFKRLLTETTVTTATLVYTTNPNKALITVLTKAFSYTT